MSKYISTLPTVWEDENGKTILNLSKEFLESLGYIIGIDDSSNEKFEENPTIQFLRNEYIKTNHEICELSNYELTNKFENALEIENLRQFVEEKNLIIFLEKCLKLQNLIMELRRLDGDDAWERI